ncbi:MAG: hypothetical protein P9L97_06080 [Candidatus Tenebribacter davisii]|nr:hypothetical protein [Candidatus Tenebribacter davisii]
MLFIVVPEANAGPWKCDIVMKNDVAIFEKIPVNAQRFKIHEGEAFLSMIPGRVQEIVAVIQELTGLEDPMSDENIEFTNTALQTYLQGKVFGSKEQLFKAYPDLDGLIQSGTIEEHYESVQVGGSDDEPIYEEVFVPEALRMVPITQFGNWATCSG